MIKKTIIPFFLMINLISLSGCSGKGGDVLPSDEVLVQDFREHSNDFDFIVKLVLKEKIYRVEIVREGVVVLPVTYSNEEIKTKLGEYLHATGVKLVNTSFEKGSFDDIAEVYFFSFRTGSVLGGESKGYSYVVDVTKKVNLVEDLSKYRSTRFAKGGLISGEKMYSKLQGNWYLFYEYND